MTFSLSVLRFIWASFIAFKNILTLLLTRIWIFKDQTVAVQVFKLSQSIQAQSMEWHFSGHHAKRGFQIHFLKHYDLDRDNCPNVLRDGSFWRRRKYFSMLRIVYFLKNTSHKSGFIIFCRAGMALKQLLRLQSQRQVRLLSANIGCSGFQRFSFKREFIFAPAALCQKLPSSPFVPLVYELPPSPMLTILQYESLHNQETGYLETAY